METAFLEPGYRCNFCANSSLFRFPRSFLTYPEYASSNLSDAPEDGMQITLRFGRRPLTIVRAPVQVRFDVEKEWLDAVRERLGGIDNVQIARLGLTVLKWAVDEIQDGRSIYSASSSHANKTPHRLVLSPLTGSAEAPVNASRSKLAPELKQQVARATQAARARMEEEFEQRAERAGEIARASEEEEP